MESSTDRDFLPTLTERHTSQRKHDPFPAHFTFGKVPKPITINLIQTALELLDRGRLEFSVLYQIWDFLQERGELLPVVVVDTVGLELEAVGVEYDRDCGRGGLTLEFCYG